MLLIGYLNYVLLRIIAYNFLNQMRILKIMCQLQRVATSSVHLTDETATAGEQTRRAAVWPTSKKRFTQSTLQPA